MARNRKRPSRDVGSDSPPSKSAKQQSISGHRGGPQGQRPRGIGKQPPQTSGRRAKAHEPSRRVRGRFWPDEDPALQGDEPSSPETLKRDPSLQGLAGRGHSARRADQR